MISIYIHIPFCSNICSYCDFSKIYYNKNYVSKYLDSLEGEIKSRYNKMKLLVEKGTNWIGWRII